MQLKGLIIICLSVNINYICQTVNSSKKNFKVFLKINPSKLEN